jgi:hypothetical protein
VLKTVPDSDERPDEFEELAWAPDLFEPTEEDGIVAVGTEMLTAFVVPVGAT